jgi:hypothetical protein
LLDAGEGASIGAPGGQYVVERRQEWQMRNRTLLALAAAAALLPGAARADASNAAPWSLTVQVWGGLSRYDVLGFNHGVGTVTQSDGHQLLQGNFNTTGGSAVIRLGWLDLGALYEGSWIKSRADSAVVTPLVGFKWDLAEFLRLDVLGELGGHQISNIGTGAGFDASQVKSVWLPYAGVRPSLSVRVPVGFARAVFSVTPFARWDLVKKTVDVQVQGTTNEFQSYEAGGSTFGVVGGLGIEL